jgi:diaminopimelate epimerase
MDFAKWHALGNAYLLVQRSLAGTMTAARVRRLCDGDVGIGSDGLLEVVRRDGPFAEIVIWNPDGSTAEMSGNGVRIAATWLARAAGAAEVSIETAGRVVHATMLDETLSELDIGEVSVASPEWIDVDGRRIELTTVSVGNPHAVIRLDSATREDLLRLGPLVETHERFPHRTNVQLVEPVEPHILRVLVWERGAGETTSSGSSSTAAAAAAIARGWCSSPVTARLPGGDLEVSFDGTRARLVGPAEEICVGDTSL